MTPLGQAEALVNWFRSGRFRYTLDPPALAPGADPLLSFLTKTAGGHVRTVRRSLHRPRPHARPPHPIGRRLHGRPAHRARRGRRKRRGRPCLAPGLSGRRGLGVLRAHAPGAHRRGGAGGGRRPDRQWSRSASDGTHHERAHDHSPHRSHDGSPHIGSRRRAEGRIACVIRRRRARSVRPLVGTRRARCCRAGRSRGPAPATPAPPDVGRTHTVGGVPARRPRRRSGPAESGIPPPFMATAPDVRRRAVDATGGRPDAPTGGGGRHGRPTRRAPRRPRRRRHGRRTCALRPRCRRCPLGTSGATRFDAIQARATEPRNLAVLVTRNGPRHPGTRPTRPHTRTSLVGRPTIPRPIGTGVGPRG